MNNEKIKILNSGYLRLVDYMGSDLSIVRSARVSYDADWRSGEDKGSDKRLINYLLGENHSPPFESVVATFEVKLPIFVARQWQRHRTQSYNEISARYVEVLREFFIPDINSITTQSKNNKQMRTDEINENSHLIQNTINISNNQAFDQYEKSLTLGCPRELARTVLPVGTNTRMFTTANLHNWFKFLTERLHPHAQYEIRVYAEAILLELKKICPVACEAFIRLKGIKDSK